jgi:hypothetical protein
MGYRPITYCVLCEEPFDVYRAPEDRICESCQELNDAAEQKIKDAPDYKERDPATV